MSENRKVLSGKLIVASHNAGKVTEINELVRAFGIETISAADLDLPEPEETGDTFIANAELKALAAAQAAGLPALADDSGLAVDALGGAPGSHSARWADGLPPEQLRQRAHGCSQGPSLVPRWPPRAAR